MRAAITAAALAVLLAGCATGHVEWAKTGSSSSDLPTAKTDCEFKLRQVGHTFRAYDRAGIERFAFTCMASHGFSGQWVQR